MRLETCFTPVYFRSKAKTWVLSVFVLAVLGSVGAQSACAAAPYAFTQPAVITSRTNVTLNGMATPNESSSTAWFQWGTSTSYGNTTPLVGIGNAAAVVPVASQLNGLDPSRLYHFRLVVSNDVSVVYGVDQVFSLGRKVVAWGDNAYGQTNVPSELSDVVAIAAGWDHNVALRSDGTVIAWGASSFDRTNVPAGLDQVVALGRGEYHTLALKADGTVVAWGFNNLGQTNVPDQLSGIISLAAGYGHNLALKNDGTLVAWGKYFDGTQYVPMTVLPGLSNVVSIAAWGYFNLALKNNGQVVAWGHYSPDGVNFVPMTVPTSAQGAVAIAAGFGHCLALKPNGTVVAWGDNSFGQTNVPSGLINVVAIACGGTHSLALKSDGTVVAWGNNYDAQCKVPLPLRAAAIDGGGQHSLVLAIPAAAPYAFTQPATSVTATSAVLNGMATPNATPSTAWFEWGTSTAYGNQTAPTSIGSGNSVVLVTNKIAGLLHSNVFHFRLVVSNSFGVVYGADRLFGISRKVWSAQTNMPAVLTNVVAVAGSASLLAIRTDGSLVGWGYNSNSLPALNNAVAVASGSRFGLALKSDGKVVAWGQVQTGDSYGVPIYGSMTIPAGLSNVVAIAAGTEHALALKNDGTVIAWGYNAHHVTEVPSGLCDVVAIGAGMWHNLVLKNDGSAVAWGSHSMGGWIVPASVPEAALTSLIDIAVAGSTDLALKADGTVLAWGRNDDGQTNVPGTLQNVVAIACDGRSSKALKCDGTVVPWGYHASTDFSIGLQNVFAICPGAALGMNQPPVASSQTVSGVPNADLIVSLSASDPEGDALVFKISTLQNSGTLYQYNAGNRGSAILTSGTQVSDSAGRVIFAPAPNFCGDTTFQFIANDGADNPYPATVTIHIAVPTISILSSGFNPEKSSFRVSFNAFTNGTYSAWASSNLLHWTCVGNAVQTAPGCFEFVEPALGDCQQRFYQLRSP